MTKEIKKVSDLVPKVVTSKIAEKASGKIAGKAISKINPMEAIKEIVTAYSDYKKIAVVEERKQAQINAWKQTELKRIEAQREILMTYLEKSFDERKEIFKNQFKYIDRAIVAAEKGKNPDLQLAIITRSLESITDLAKSSPFKDIASVSQVRKMIEDKDEPINL